MINEKSGGGKCFCMANLRIVNILFITTEELY